MAVDVAQSHIHTVAFVAAEELVGVVVFGRQIQVVCHCRKKFGGIRFFMSEHMNCQI